jgi:hypothetical protein
MVKLLGIFISSGIQRQRQRGEMIGGRYTVVNGLQSAQPHPIINHSSTIFHSNVMEGVMSSLPLLFKKEGLIEKHQVEGVDPSDRYFNRTVLVNRTASGYAAKVMYEALNVEGHSHPTITAAVQELIEAMQRFGFSRMRTRANFKGTKYLAEKETWVDYQDLA